MINWESIIYDINKASKDFEKLQVKSTSIEPINPRNEFKELRQKLIKARDDIFEAHNLDNANKLEYSFDLLFGLEVYQILNEDRNANYIVIGIQAFGNTKALFERAQAFQVKYVLEEQLTEQPEEIWKQQIQEFIEKQDVVIVTLCMDVVNASAAPGVSAPSVFGLSPQLVRKLLRYIMQFNKVISFDICEVNPSVDEGERTAKLAANFVNEVVYQLAKKH